MGQVPARHFSGEKTVSPRKDTGHRRGPAQLPRPRREHAEVRRLRRRNAGSRGHAPLAELRPAPWPQGFQTPSHPRPLLGELPRMGRGGRWRLPVSRANPVMLSGTGSRFRYAGSCTFTMRATLSSTILTGGVRSSPSPAPQQRLRQERRRLAGARTPASQRRAGLRTPEEVSCPAPIGSGRVSCAPIGPRGCARGRGSEPRNGSVVAGWVRTWRRAFYVSRRWRSAGRILCRGRHSL